LGKSHLLRNTQHKKNIAIGRYGQYQKIISANSTFPFKEKETVLRLEGFYTDEINKKSNVKT
jgi:hypothetical protein